MELFDAVMHFYYEMTLNELQMINRKNGQPDISYNSLLYLDAIDHTPQCTASGLAQLMGISKPAVTAKVNELVRLELVAKTPSPSDGRVSYLHVSSEARRNFLQYDVRVLAALHSIQQQFPPAQIDSFCEMLGIFSKQYTKEQQKEFTDL